MGELSGKVAIVTGASKGIGSAIALRFGEAGAAVAVNYSTDKAGADRVVERIKRDGGKAVAIQANVSKSADVKRLFAETKAKFGALNILVNNAGVFTFEPLEAVTEEAFHRQFDTNVLGTLLATQEAVTAFNGEGGSVINISTISSINPVPSSVVYSASKAAIDSITKALAKELGDRKIRVNAIAPGMTESEGFKALGITRNCQSDRFAYSTRTAGSARRHRTRGAVPGLRSIILVDRRTHLSVWRSAVA
jgi:3-oxoacyl-[acyl-carrier protein] reductase